MHDRTTPRRRGPRAGRTVPRAHGVVALGCTAMLALASGACARDTHEASWPDLVTARQQDAIERGWLPAFLPEEARDIHQRNEPSTGSWIAVATLPSDLATTFDECNGTAATSPPLEAPWFPTAFTDPQSCTDGWTLARMGDQVALWRVDVPQVQ